MKFCFLILVFLLTGCIQPESSSLNNAKGEWLTTVSGRSVMARAMRVTDHFNDPQLTQLVSDVLVNNNDLAVAGFHLQQAWLAAGLIDETRFPGLSASGGATNSQQLKPKQPSTESWQSDASLSWEIDLWGKVARQHDQSVWQAQASDSDRLATALSLIKTTAELYWSIALSNVQLKNYESQLVISEQLKQLVESQYQAGAVSASDRFRAEQSVLQMRLSYDALVAKRDKDRHALAILFDSSPRKQRPEKLHLPNAGTTPGPKAIPVSALSERPDVHSAEMQLRAALAGSDVARLNFYPTLSVSGTVGAANAVFSQWFAHPSRSVSANLALPFLQWDAIMLTIENADLDVKAAEADFRTKVWKALSEAEDALTESQHALTQYEMRGHNLRLSQALWQQEKIRFIQGDSSLQDVLDAESNWLQAENDIQNVNYDYLSGIMKLWLTFDSNKTGVPVQQKSEGT